jgi:hypothetical protein
MILTNTRSEVNNAAMNTVYQVINTRIHIFEYRCSLCSQVSNQINFLKNLRIFDTTISPNPK